MKVILASSERFAGCMVHALVRAGHEVVGVFSPIQGIYDHQFESWRYSVYSWIDWDIASACKRYKVPFRVSRHLGDGSAKLFIRQSGADLLLVFGWPRLISQEVLKQFSRGGINIHPSLLPKMRGGDPIFALVEQYQLHFGITFHKLTPELDAGPIYWQKPLDFSPHHTYDYLYFKAIRAINRNLPQALQALENHPEGQPQKGEPTVASSFKRKIRFLDPAHPIALVGRRALACYSHHAMLTTLGDEVISFSQCNRIHLSHSQEAPPGTILALRPFSLDVKLGDGHARLQGIRFWDQPWWRTPILLIRHFQQGGQLGSPEHTRRCLRQKRRLQEPGVPSA